MPSACIAVDDGPVDHPPLECGARPFHIGDRYAPEGSALDGSDDFRRGQSVEIALALLAGFQLIDAG
jgi:hypothetical protein